MRMFREVFEKQEKLLGEVFSLLVMPFFVGIIFHYFRTYPEMYFKLFYFVQISNCPGK